MESQPNPPFRSFSSNSSGSLSSLQTNITRVALGPLLAMSNLNRTSLPEDHLYYQCAALKQRLEKINGMGPFLDLAFDAAEQSAEQQALALSQQLLQQQTANDFRSLVSSAGFSIHSDTSANGAQALPTSTHHPSISNIFTFTLGVLPANISVDPATQLWKLFQQGAPLCLIFNWVYPNYEIPIIGSDDLRVCKKSVYDFLIAVKMHLNLDDDFMFTISNVFSDNTHDLLKIVKVVNKLLALNKDAVSFEVDPIPSLSELSISDDRLKVFKEIVETERKYVQDLELLLAYKNELSQAELVSSEQLHTLFPNLNEIIDFQRRFLNGLECNINIPTKYQRIGLVFIHAALGPFAAYEPWTVGQLLAIDLINKEAANLRKSSQLMDPGFELQSYILKPIQRLCKYPLLLKELIKATPDPSDLAAASYNELVLANQAMKEVANRVNEAQRRAENVGYLQSLVDRVSNWRGFNLKDQGELLHHGRVGVRDAENEKEYVAYLFERIIFFFVEVNQEKNEKKKEKRREILSTRKKSSASVTSSSTVNLLESLNSAKDKSQLELKGRVYISEIYNISSSNSLGYTLVIAWLGKKESGSFTLRYRNEEARNQWETCLRNLKTNEMNTQIHKKLRDLHVLASTNELSLLYDVTSAYANTSPLSNAIPPNQVTETTPPSDSVSFRLSNGLYRHHSSLLTFSMMRQARTKSELRQSSQSTSANHDGLFLSQGSGGIPVPIRLVYNRMEISGELVVMSSIQFSELHQKITSKVASSDEVNDDILVSKLKYKDEDGDFVVMDSTDDWALALDMLDELGPDRTLTIWVS